MSPHVAPIFPVSDLEAALGRYGELGFGAHAWRGGGVLIDPDGNVIRFGSPMDAG